MTIRGFPHIWAFMYLLVLVWSGIRPHDYFTWFLEVAPAIAAFIIVLATGKRFPLTPLVYWLILVHAIVLMVGGHYTYAQVPLFNWIRDEFGLARNHYDKLGHLVQGFVPAMIAREILLRTSPLKPGNWLSFIVVSVCLAISAFYELIEWWVAALTGTGAEAFLGTQGYVWDTQSDMAMALAGALLALATLTPLHDRQLAALNQGSLNR